MRNIRDLTREELVKYDLSSTHFNLYFNITKQYKRVFDVLVKEVDHSTSCSKEVWCVVTNVARALNYGAIVLRIPRHKDSYVGNGQKLSCIRMKEVVDTLCERGYFDGVVGGLIGDDHYISMYKMQEKLFDLWEGVETAKEVEYHPTVIIKDRETKTFKSTQGVSGVGAIHKEMSKYNQLLSKVSLCKDGVAIS